MLRRLLVVVLPLLVALFAALGVPLDELEREARQVAASAPPLLAPAFREFIGDGFVDVGLLRGDAAWAWRMGE